MLKYLALFIDMPITLEKYANGYLHGCFQDWYNQIRLTFGQINHGGFAV